VPVPVFAPFRGIRYVPTAIGGTLDAVAAPPYDVIDDAERTRLEQAHPYNAVRLILPRDAHAPGDRYARAAADLARWRDAGVLRTDPQPRFYGYRMRFTDPRGRRRETVGVIGALALPEGDPAAAGILPHERTLAKAKSDRLALLRATRANFDPIWLLSLAEGLTEHLRDGELLGRCTDADGTDHEVFAIDGGEAVAEIGRLVGAAPAVLADGHHRFETACALRDELRAAGEPLGGAAAVMALVVELADDQLCIEPIHRAVRAPGVDVCRRLDGFDRTALAPPVGVEALLESMAARGALGVVDRGGVALLTPTEAGRAAVASQWPATVCGTDAAVIEALVVPALPGATWEYRHDAGALVAAVRAGEADAAFLLRPVSVAETRAAALAGDRMPQKTTFFYPKPRTGLVLRAFDT
jgi:uncharacterized protein (DUF1015 family)